MFPLDIRLINLQVLTEAFASRVIFADESVGNDLVAIGVEFIHGGKTHFVRAKEVIISAGSDSCICFNVGDAE